MRQEAKKTSIHPVSANRWHVDVRLEEPTEVDRELKSRLKTAYELSG
jgi:hypothetical protein